MPILYVLIPVALFALVLGIAMLTARYSFEPNAMKSLRRVNSEQAHLTIRMRGARRRMRRRLGRL